MINNINSAAAVVQQLKRLTPKKLSENVSQEEFDKLGEAQQLALKHAKERTDLARKSSLQSLERIALYQRLADAAIRRGDVAGAERAARQANAAARLASGNTKAAKTAANEARSDSARAVAKMVRELEQDAQKYAQQLNDAVRAMKRSGKPISQSPTSRLHDLALSYGALTGQRQR